MSKKELIDYIFENANWNELFVLFYWYCFNYCKIKTFIICVNKGMSFKYAFEFAKI